jgi:SAM-dependent methyltransferase
VKKMLDSVKKKVGTRARPLGFVEHDGFALPPSALRFCGAEYKDDAYFLKSARLDAKRLVEHCGLTTASRVLDLGCGPGRLAIGIMAEVGDVAEYVGLDVHRPSIEWCKRVLGKRYPKLRFEHLDVSNERYNPQGTSAARTARLPLADASVDVFNLYSVFSHMSYGDIVGYLKELRRVCASGGHGFLTVFVEENVPNYAVNPPGYLEPWSGALHCVRFERQFFEEMLAEAGLKPSHFVHGRETNGQSAYYVSPVTP